MVSNGREEVAIDVVICFCDVNTAGTKCSNGEISNLLELIDDICHLYTPYRNEMQIASLSVTFLKQVRA